MKNNTRPADSEVLLNDEQLNVLYNKMFLWDNEEDGDEDTEVVTEAYWMDDEFNIVYDVYKNNKKIEGDNIWTPALTHKETEKLKSLNFPVYHKVFLHL